MDTYERAEAYNKTVGRMEKDIMMVDRDAALTSIAISLRRIADKLENANLNGDILAQNIEGAIYRGLNR